MGVEIAAVLLAIIGGGAGLHLGWQLADWLDCRWRKRHGYPCQ